MSWPTAREGQMTYNRPSQTDYNDLVDWMGGYKWKPRLWAGADDLRSL